MATLGQINFEKYLINTKGEVIGRQLSDGKDRIFKATYKWESIDRFTLKIKRDGSSEYCVIPKIIPLDEALTAFFGLYSGDGAKGSEKRDNPGTLQTSVSFSQYEPNLVKFAVIQFKLIFPEATFTFSLGEDSAYFMGGEGFEMLKQYYNGKLPPLKELSKVRPNLDRADQAYLAEKRIYQKNPIDDLAFFYQHKEAMKEILIKQKSADIASVGLKLDEHDKVTASLRRPFKKGARQFGGSSRSDEVHVGNVTGMGEIFLKIMHEIEESILENKTKSPQELIEWSGRPKEIGKELDIKEFFEESPFGSINNKRPSIKLLSRRTYLEGLWPASKLIPIAAKLKLNPLWCYVSGLYFAEGTTTKSKLFAMFSKPLEGSGLGFTSSENTSLELILTALQQLFPKEICLESWKIKVGSQYFPELVVVGLKNAVPMLRGGNSGDGKIRTMEISLAIKDWALDLAPVMREFENRYSHVEPTGAGVPRIDFSASSALCKWYFPLIVYTLFHKYTNTPSNYFNHE